MRHGRLQLLDWMERRRWNHQEASDALGYDKSFLSLLCHGKRQATLAVAVNIARQTGIPVEAWLATDPATDQSEKATVSPK